MQLSAASRSKLLKEGGPRSLGGRSGRRIHQGLVVAEIALAVMLLSGAGLLIRSFLRVQSANRGFDSNNVLLLQVDLPGSLRQPGEDGPHSIADATRASARCRASSRSAPSATSSSTASPITASRSRVSRRGGLRIPLRR